MHLISHMGTPINANSHICASWSHIRSRVCKPVHSRKVSLISIKLESTLPTKCIFKKSSAISSSNVSTEPISSLDDDERFDWFSQWYALMPVCDLDKKAPHGKKVMGLDVVVWWDKNDDAWKVFDDSCPHRLAPLSDGRIDEWGRLQCAYHGWCFGGYGECKFIPQAPSDGHPVHTSKKACVAVYPSTVQNGLVWFWPNTEPQYKDILTKKKPPYIPELDDPSFKYQFYNRDIPYGYEILMENLLDPSHLPYAHYGIVKTLEPRVKLDREGGKPIGLNVEKIDKNGFSTNHQDGFVGLQQNGRWNFLPPCLVYATFSFDESTNTDKEQLATNSTRKELWVFIGVPVSPGNCRLISVFPRNCGFWMGLDVPRWIQHGSQNLVIDSDLYLLHVEEKRFMEAGVSNWQKVCFVPTRADANVVTFRKWLKKYAGGQIDWGNKFNGSLPATPPREQLLDRYWTHVVNCSSCSAIYKGFNALKIFLEVFSLVAVGIAAATKHEMISVAARNTLVVASILSFVGSKWLSHFIYKNFHYHDYNHAVN